MLTVPLRLNKDTDIIEGLERLPAHMDKAGYVRELIRRDIMGETSRQPMPQITLTKSVINEKATPSMEDLNNNLKETLGF